MEDNRLYPLVLIYPLGLLVSVNFVTFVLFVVDKSLQTTKGDATP